MPLSSLAFLMAATTGIPFSHSLIISWNSSGRVLQVGVQDPYGVALGLQKCVHWRTQMAEVPGIDNHLSHYYQQPQSPAEWTPSDRAMRCR